MAQVLVDNDVKVTDWPYMASSRTQVWYDSTTVFEFYVVDNTGKAASPDSIDVAYSKSTDSGVTWGAPAFLFAIGTGFIDIDVYYERWHDTTNDPIVHVVGHDDTGTSRGYYYNNVNLQTGATSTAGGLYIRISTSHPAGGPLGIGCDRNATTPVIHAVGFSGTFGSPVHVRSTNGGVTWGDSTDQDFGQARQDLIQLWPDASSADTADMLAFWHDESADTLKVSGWDNSAGTWGSAATISTGINRVFNFNNFNTAYDRTTGNVVVVAFVDSASPNTLKCWEVAGTATITARTNVLTNVADSNTCAVQVAANGDWYVAYMRAGFVYYKVSTDNGVTWGSETAYSTVNESVRLIQLDPAPSVAKFLPAYFSEDDENLYVEGVVSTDTAVALAGQLTINFQLSGTLTGVTPSTPPVVVKCRPISVFKVITATLGTR